MKFKKIEVPFPIGVEYFRSGVPKREVWEKDFFEIKRRGFNIVRTASYWNWMEPSKGQYKLDDIDAFFDLAKDNGLYVWIDIISINENLILFIIKILYHCSTNF